MFCRNGLSRYPAVRRVGIPSNASPPNSTVGTAMSRMMGTKADPSKRTIFYQYRADRARRTLKGIDEQIAKAEKAVAGQAAVKRNRFVQLTGAIKSVNRDLEAKARALAGLKGYVTNLEAPTAEYVMAPSGYAVRASMYGISASMKSREGDWGTFAKALWKNLYAPVATP
jgi:hypothetical protein